MYRTWVLIFSMSVLLPARLLSDVMPKGSNPIMPVLPLVALIACGELVLNNPTVSPAGPYCPGQSFNISFTGTNLPDGGALQVYGGLTSGYNPCAGGGTLLGTVPIDYPCTDCPKIQGIMINACGTEQDNEFMLLDSGCGFNVSSLSVDLLPAGVSANDIGNGTPCPFTAPSGAAMALLQASSPCSNLNIIAAGAGTNIPAAALVIVLMTNSGPSVGYNLSALCSTGLPIYVIQNSCALSSGAFANDPCPGGKTYSINVSGCPINSVTYPCGIGIPNPASTGHVFMYASGTSWDYHATNCDNSAMYSSISFPDETPTTMTLNYTIPAGQCGASSGNIPYYIGGFVNSNAPCANSICTPPTALSISVACPNLMGTVDVTNVNCAGVANGQAVYIAGSPGELTGFTLQWDNAGTPGNDVYPDDGSIGLANVPNGNYYFIATSPMGCADTIAFTINVFDPVTYTAIVATINCFGGTTGTFMGIDLNGVNDGDDPPGIYIYDWDMAGGANDDYGSPPADNDPEDIYNLSAGTYYLTITVTDDIASPTYSCDYLDTFVITQPTQIVGSIASSNVLCFGGTASITASGSGGTPGYSYNWSNIPGNPTFPATEVATQSVIAGNYVVTVTDSKGCSSSSVVMVTGPAAALSATATGETIPCNNNSGDITLTVTGGTAGYTYDWSNDGPEMPDNDPQNLSGLNAGTYTVTVTDFNGCTATTQAMVILLDNTVPTITCPANVTLAGCNGVVPAPNPASVVATDACGPPVVTFVSDVPNTAGCTQTITRTYRATDVNGNTATCTQTITRTVDVTPPGITCPANVTLAGCNTAVPAPTPGTVVATDGCSPPTVTFVSDVVSTVGCTQTTTRTYQATDACLNTATCTQTIVRTVDVTPPTITCPANVTLAGCNGVVPAPTPGSITTSDGCGTVVVTFVSDVLSTVGCQQITTRTYQATDICGNTATCSHTITRTVDSTPPTITCPANITLAGCNMTVPAPTPGSVVATDACGTPTVTFVSDVLSTVGCIQTTTRTYQATDACLNTATCTQTIVRTVDVTPPTITCPANVTLAGCNAAVPAPTPGSVVATDGCGSATVTFVSDVLSTVGCIQTTTRTYQATDACLNTATCTQTIVRTVDVTPPTITCPANVTLAGCNGVVPAPTPGSIATSDGCGAVVVTFVSDVLSTVGCQQITTRTYQATDVCGNTATCSHTITRTVDSTPPTITCPANVTLAGCNMAVPAPTPGSVVATDACGAPTVTFVSDVLSTVGCIQTTTRTYQATDACLNTATCTQTITRTVDITPPTITCPANVTLAGCNTAVPAPTPGSIVATDACGAPTVTFVSDVLSTVGCVQTTTRTYQATDACLNTSTCTQTIVRTVDITPPTITCPANVTLAGCNGVVPAPTPGSIVTTDGCGTSVVTFISDVLSTVGCQQITTRTYQATDPCGNTATCSHTITRTVDSAPPTITCPANVTLAGCNMAVPAPTPGSVVASDACGPPTVTFVSDVLSTVGCIQTTTRTYQAADACGNTATCTQTIVRTVDITPPTITCPANVTLAGCNTAVPAPTPGSIVATDACGAPVVTFVSDVVSTVGCLQTTTRTYQAADACGNTATCSHTIQRTVDITPPTITCPANVTLAGCNTVVPAPTPGSIVATDGCGAPVVTFVSDVLSVVGCSEITTRTYQATDLCGNTATCAYTLTRTLDITPPTITCPANVTLAGCNVAVPAPNIGTVTAADACGAPTVTFISDAVNTVGCTQTTTRTYQAADACGNTATCTQTITRTVDITPPSITCPVNITLSGCNATVPVPNIGSVTTTDGCSTTTVTFISDVNSTVGCVQTTTRTYQATDACGNTATCTQTITRTMDVTAPTITCPANVVLPGCNGVIPAPNPGSVTGGDGCGTPTITFISDVVSLVGCTETTTRTYQATDACGNTSTCAQTLTRTLDITPPTITCPANVTLAGCNVAVPAPSIGTVVAADGCGPPTVTFISDVVSLVGCTETTTRTYQAADACGSTATCTQTITRTVDITPPAITCPANITLAGCNTAVPAPTPGSIVATDACGAPVVTFISDVLSTVGCIQTTTRRYQATDLCGNTSTCTHTIVRTVDITPPAITCPANVTLAGCSTPVPAPTPGSIVATDGCGAPTVTFVSDVLSLVGCNETTTRTYQATDACGNTATCSHTITRILDVTPPTITCPANVTLAGCNTAVPAPTPGSVVASDGCGPPTVTFISDVASLVGCLETTTRTYQAADACGSTATCTQTITRTVDVTPPTITCPANVTLAGCNTAVPAPTPGSIVATDACGAPVVTFISDVVNTVGCIETTTRRYQATDLCGNTATCTHTIARTVDITPPTITCPANVTLAGCNGVVPAPAPGSVVATDACGAPVVTFISDVVSLVGCIETTTRRYQATDACGNTATCNQTITRTLDVTPPTITCPANVTLAGCNTAVPAPTPGSVVATDGCGAPVVTFISDVASLVGCTETTTRTYQATDACGSTATCTQTITRTVDVTPPAITCPANVTLAGCNTAVPAPTPGSVVATDACGAPVVTFISDVVNTVGCIETTTRRYQATDLCGNTATCTHTIARTVDITPPTITCPANVTLAGCNGVVPVPAPGSVVATDACGAPVVTFISDVVSLVGCTETTTRRYQATDACGNTATCNQTITRTLDVTPPTITCPANVTLAGCNTAVPAPTPGSIVATDGCGAPVVTFISDVANLVGCTETTTRTYQATDACGSTATCTQTITRTVDVTPPTITCPANVTLAGCNTAVPAPTPGSVVATDACGAPVVTFINDVLNTVGCIETTTRRYQATDLCGNTATCTQTIARTVDIAPPTITCPANVTLAGCNPPVPAPTPGSVVATDACGAPTVTFISDVVNLVGCTETTTRTYQATDACGNTATCTQTINRIIDITPPTITCPANVTLAGCNTPVPAPSPGSVVATDGCGAPVVTFISDVVNLVGCTETTTRTYQATDACGSTATCTQTITRTLDITPPAITCPANVTLAGCNTAVPAPTPGSIVATDACGAPVVTFISDVVNTVGCVETTTRRYQATDLCGNTATCTQTIARTVDIAPPTITCPANVTLAGCNAPVPAPTPGSVVATDACGAPTVTFISDVINLAGCIETTTRTYQATDACGNTATCAQTITRTVDITPPTITCPANLTLSGCNAVVPAPAPGSVVSTDGCGAPVVTFVSDVTNLVGCNETTTRTYMATDACGTTATCTQTITRTVDALPPTITCPANITLAGCNATVPAPTPGSIVASDACGVPTVTFVSDVVSLVGCTETTTRTYQAADACGNTATCSHTISRTLDSAPPSITCPANVTLAGCNAAVPVPNIASVTATDACGPPTVTFVSDVVNLAGCLETTTRIYQATDACGNTATCAQTISRTVDTTAPSITCPANVSLPGCNATVPAPNIASVTATDACGVPTVTFISDVVSITGCTETTTRTYQATDPCGNTATCTHTITRTIDLAPPSITCPANVTLAGCNATVPAPDITSVTSSDACGAPTITFVSDVVSLVGCTETTTRTYQATDACGNTATCSQTIARILDSTPPAITCPANATLPGCNAVVPAPNISLVTATDACGAPTVTFISDVINLAGCTETTTRTYQATDACGNTATCAQTITRTVDTTAPAITCPANVTLPGCNATVPVPNIASVTATDACGAPTITFISDVVNIVGCTETTTRTYQATDPCGNTATCTHTITRTIDSAPPAITCPANVTLPGCNATVPAPDITTVSATDACGAPTITFVSDAISLVGCIETTTRIYQATDACGNTATCSHTISRSVDTTPPAITCPANVTLSGCNAVVPAPAPGSVVATDACGAPTVTFVSDVVNLAGCIETTTRTYQAADACGNTSTCAQTITRTVDSTPPVITCPANATLPGCNAAVPAPDISTVIVTDACGVPTVTFVSDVVNITGCSETTTRTYQATDACGNTATCSHTITRIVDSSPPGITCPANVTLSGCNATVPAPDITSVIVTDACGSPTITFVSDVINLAGCIETTTRTYQALDACGNTATCSHTISRTVDTTPPTITCPANVTLSGCNAAVPAPTPGSVVATDACGAPTVTFVSDAVNLVGCIETTTRTYQAADACGNTATCSQTISRTVDITPPTITCPANATLPGCNATVPVPDISTVIATDACGAPTITFVSDIVNISGCSETTTRTYQATDACGNTATCIHTITRTIDNAPPSITCPANVSLPGCNAAVPVPDITSIVATDACGAPTITFVSDAVSLVGCIETTTRTYQATDACGNTATCSHTITRTVDTTPPAITCPANITIAGCNAVVPAPTPGSVVATDACGAPTVTFINDAVSLVGCIETTTRTYQAADACGNTSTCAQTITRTVDSTPPTITCPVDVTLAGCNPSVPAPDISTVTVSDACGTPTVTFISDVVNITGCIETTTRTYQALDACGNTATCSQLISRNIDAAPPAISCPANVTLAGCNAAVPAPDVTSVTATDGCGAPIVTFVSDVANLVGCIETTTRTYLATDACGNTATCTQSITRTVDITPPAITCPANVTLSGCNGIVPVPNIASVTATDACGVPTVTFVSDVVNLVGCTETTTRTYQAADACGNTSTCAQTITRTVDSTPPAITCPTDVTLAGCNPTVPAPDVSTVTATDACGTPTVTFVSDVVSLVGCTETTTRTYQAADACGNTSTCSQLISRNIDSAPPSITCPANVTLSGCNAAVPAPDVTAVTSADGCGAPTITFVSDAVNVVGCIETTTRIYQATDVCGNTATCSQTITRTVDVTPPSITCPANITLSGCNGVVPVANIASVTATDACGAPTITFISDVVNLVGCIETTTRTYQAADACGNTSTCAQTIVRTLDSTPPSITCPGDVTLAGCNPVVPVPDITAVTATDACGAPAVTFVSDVVNVTGCTETTTRIYQATDACGNTATCDQILTRSLDATPPSITCPANITLAGCNATVAAPDISSVIATDACGAPTVTFVSDVVNVVNCVETTTRIYQASDACGNTATCAQTITRTVDATPPTITCPIDVVVPGCNGVVPAPNIATVIVADGCTPPTVTFISDVVSLVGCTETTIRTYQATDACGNTATCTQSITRTLNNTPPSITCPGDVTLAGCNPAVPAPDITSVSTSGSCGVPVITFISDVVSVVGCTETTTRTYQATDPCANTATCTQIITRSLDATPPTITCPANITLAGCNATVPASDISTVIATDACGAPIVTFVSDVVNVVGCIETTTRTYQAADACGNTSTCAQTITRTLDVTPPSITCPATLNLPGCNAAVPAPDVASVTSTDGCSPPTVVFVDDVVSVVGCTETTIRTYQATDACGNTATCAQTITRTLSSTPPSITCPANVTLAGCNVAVPAPDITSVSTSGSCSTPTVSFINDVTNLVGCIETTTRTYQAVDACGNTASCAQTITRTFDITPPSFVPPIPFDVTVQCIGQVPPMEDLDYTDNCSPSGTVTGTQTGPSGMPLTIVRTWVATDACGNSASVVQTITITENNMPVDITEDLCPGETVTINGEIYDTPGVFADTIPGMNGECDTIISITIIGLMNNTEVINADLCPGETITIHGTVYSSGGTYSDTWPGGNGECDTLVTINITDLPYNHIDIDESLCPGETITIYGTQYDMSGVYQDTVSSSTGGCDTTVTITIIDDALISNDITVDVCENEFPVVVYGQSYPGPGTFMDIVPSTTGGCDTSVTITINSLDLPEDPFNYTGCEGDGFTVTINGTVYNEGNPTGSETVPGIGAACDTIVDVTLVFASNAPAQIDPQPAVCTAASVITLTASPAGGVWSGDVSSDQFDPAALGAGTYEVIYTFNAGACSSADTINITVYELVISCMATVEESAPGASDGEGEVTISGGIPPYNVSWAGPVSGSIVLNADGSFVISGLSGGVYTITVEDNSGCSTTCQFIIDSNIPCTVVIDEIQVQDAACSGINNGTATILASGGIAPLEYSVDALPFQSGNIFINLTPGTHTAHVRDITGCQVDLDFVVGVGPGPTLAEVEVIEATCGVANGSIEVEATGGTPNYQFAIDGGPHGASGLFSGLGAGMYEIDMVDAAGCTDTIQVIVDASNAPVITNVIVVNASCGQSDGSLTIIATGGQPPLQYSIEGGANPQSSNVFNGLPSGSYDVVVIDDTGCQTPIQVVNVDENGAPTIVSIPTTQTSCSDETGTITINATGGATPYMYSITGGAPFQNANLFTDLGPGTYDIVVKDDNGCQVNGQATITTINGPQITDVDVVHTTCGEDNGMLDITIVGGTQPYEIFINTTSYGDETEIGDLEADVYDITVVDDNGCSAVTQATINPSIAPDFDFIVEPAHCGLPDGDIILDPSSGTPPYQFSKDGEGGPFSPVVEFHNLVSDFYLIAMKDAKGCIIEKEVFVFEIPGPTIDSVSITPPDCGLTNGTFVVHAHGHSDITYAIKVPVYQADSVFNNVVPDTYTVTVKDEFGCTDAMVVVMPSTPAPAITAVNHTDTPCGQSAGTITITAISGTPPLMYSVHGVAGPFQTSNLFTGLASDTYDIYVKGANGCDDSDTETIISTGAQTSNINASICLGDSIFIENDTFFTPGPHTILIPGGAANGCDSIINLNLTLLPLQLLTLQETICANEVFTINGIDYNVAGSYLIDTINGTTGCDTIRTLQLTVDTLIIKHIDVTICTGGSYTIGGNTFTAAGDYLVDTVSAVTGCDSVRMLHLSIDTYNAFTIDREICQGEVFTINGIDYTVTGIFVVDTLLGSGPGVCDTILNLDLTVNLLPIADAGFDKVLDCASTAVDLDGTATGGTPHWTGPDIDAGNENMLMPIITLPGQYILTVTSPKNCTATDTVKVTLDPQTVIASAGIDDSLSCDVTSITLQGSPSGPNYTYQWTGPGINAGNEHQQNPVVSAEGLYTLVVTDIVSNCVSSPDEVFIDDISFAIVAIIQDPNNSLNCLIDTLDLETTGSTTGPTIKYIWFNSAGEIISTSPDLVVSSGGMFTFMVEDTISGCFDSTSIMIEDLTQYPSINAGPDQFIDCNNLTTVLVGNGAGNPSEVTYLWTGPVGGIMTSPTNLTVTVSLPGTYYLTATDQELGCQNSDSALVSDNMVLPIADINIQEIITCIDETALLDIGNSSSGAQYDYEWMGSGINGMTTTTVEPSQAGTFILIVNNQANGCSANDTVTLILPVLPTDMLADITKPFCLHDSTGMISITQVTGGLAPFTYSLNGGMPQTSPDFDLLPANTYSLMVTDANGCTYEENFIVPEGDPIILNIGPDLQLELGETIELDPTLNAPWTWISTDSLVWIGDSLSCLNCLNPTLLALQNGIITATVYAGDCMDSDTLAIRVDVDADIYVPNVFSPNHDGINDGVTVWADDRVRRIVYLEIFDRWGNQVFVANDILPNDPLLGWDGTFKGRDMNPAVFAYIAQVELINGQTINKKGDITLLR